MTRVHLRAPQHLCFLKVLKIGQTDVSVLSDAAGVLFPFSVTARGSECARQATVVSGHDKVRTADIFCKDSLPQEHRIVIVTR